jgi:hypothetical protein
MYATPLYAAAVKVGGGTLPVVFAATSNGAVYALAARALSCEGGASTISAGQVLWKAQLGQPVVVPGLDGQQGFPGVAVGILSTPVYDVSSSTLYAVALDGSGGAAPVWRAWALEAGSGAVLPGWPVTFTPAAVEPVNTNGAARFETNTLLMAQRPALALSNDGGLLYVGFGGFGDHAVGWLAGVDTRAARVATAFSGAQDTASECNSGLWAPGGPAVDDDGRVFLTVGNGPASFIGQPHAWGESALAWSRDLTLSGTYAPWDFCQMEQGDADLGGDAPMLVPNLDPGSTSTPRLAVFGSKQGTVYALDREHMPGSLDARQACAMAWDSASHDQSLLPPGPAAAYCNPQSPSQCVSGPLVVFGPYTEDPGANNLDMAKMRGTPAYLRAPDGTRYVFFAGSNKATVDPPTDGGFPGDLGPALVRVRVVLASGAPAYLAMDAASPPTTAFHNPGSPVVTSHDGGHDAVVWVLDQNDRRTRGLMDPGIHHPVVYALDATTMGLLWQSGDGVLDVGGKYGAPTVADGTVYVGTDRIEAFGLGP